MLILPPCLLGLTLGFWAWQLGHLWLGVGGGLAIEAARLFPRYRRLSDAVLRGAVGLTLLFLLGAGLSLMAAFSGDTEFGTLVLRCVAWLPAGLLPPMVALAWRSQLGLDLNLLRLRQDPKSPDGPHFQPAWPAWAACLLAAGSVPNVHGDVPWFYPGLGLILIWAVCAHLAGQGRTSVRAAVLLILLGLGFILQFGLHTLQESVQEHFGEWFLGQDNTSAEDPGHISTAIGHTGRLSFPGRIVMRVTSSAPLNGNLLLREASFTTYTEPDWLTHQGNFAALQADPSGNRWILSATAAGKVQQLGISQTFPHGHVFLALPAGAVAVGSVTAHLESNRLGSVVVRKGRPWLNYTITYTPQGEIAGAPPDAADLQVPASIRPALAHLAANLHLSAQSPAQAMTIVSQYFAANFRYSLQPRIATPQAAPLLDFLQNSHAGHCEYFATATVLLLRSAGIPARYATGYLVQEYDEAEQTYVVRARHAHAWAEVYADGLWHDLDTTPATWLNTEEAQTNRYLQNIWDDFDWLCFRVTAWVQQNHSWPHPAKFPWLWLGLPVMSGLLWRAIRRGEKPHQQTSPRPDNPLEEAWSAFEAAMRAAGQGRFIWESPKCWAARIHDKLNAGAFCELLEVTLKLRYRARFDPRGLDSAAQQALIRNLKTLTQTIPGLWR